MKRFRRLIAIGFAWLALQAGATIANSPPIALAAIAPALPLSKTARPAPGMFLVAKRALDGSYFDKTVIYLVEHDEQGTLGLIVNRSSEIRLTDALPDIDAKRAAAHSLYYGGPVELSIITMLIRGQTPAKGTALVADSVHVSRDRSVLDAALTANKSSSELRLYIGYSGWGAGQLDAELRRGSWHVVPASADAVFSADSDSLWQQLIERLEPEGIEVRKHPAPAEAA